MGRLTDPGTAVRQLPGLVVSWKLDGSLEATAAIGIGYGNGNGIGI